ncbi:uncharacterized membrane protein YoaK (UPF0700 family) [Collimonas sp. PA-H2]|uniref:YoaK family protein n=1 Tax=Collimonas sp. PA-H2 TaxID=1881062 RepID=UPI000C0181F0|nr:YoaK family protein [Collimonas sp. PA-H2]PFH08609.1 uncharacterized membrane protein YoaK (UPF0700 family) [Collimonas sp. PA-H2]
MPDMNNLRTRQSIALSFLAGYVDTVGFIALFGLFTAHVTGNFVLIGSELANPSHGVLIKLLAFPAFIFAVALTRMVVIWLERGGRAPLFYLLLLQLVFLLGFMLAGYLVEPVTDSRAPLALLAGMLGAAAMGVQNASSRLLLQHLTPTTVMTGNVTQVIIDLVDIARGAATEEIRQRCSKFFWPIVAFGAGAIGGAFAYKHLLFLALLLPLALLLWLSIKEYLSEKSGAATPSTL